MNFEWVQQYCLAKPLVDEGFPFDSEVIAWKVAGKLFCLSNINSFDSINLKASPEQCIEWREEFEQVQPGYHMNKKHWNTVTLNGMTEKNIAMMIDTSYREVVAGLPKKLQSKILSMQ